MAEVEIEFPPQKLTAPTATEMRSVYRQLVLLLLGMRPEELEQPHFAASQVLTYPELYDEAIPEIAFARALKKLMVSVGVNDFQMSDLNKPESKRMVRYLSAIINFLKFRGERRAKFDEYDTEFDALEEQKNELESKNQECKEELDKLKRRLQAEQPMVDHLTAETQSLGAEVEELNKFQWQLQQDWRSQKNELRRLEAISQNNMFKIMNLKQDGQKLRSQIVQDPEKLKKAIIDMEEQVEVEKKTIGDAEVKARELSARLGCLRKLEESILKCVAVMNECSVETDKLQKQKEQIDDAQAGITEANAESRELESRQLFLAKQLQAAAEKLVRLEKVHKEKQEAAQQALVEAKSDRTAAEKEREEAQAKIEENEKFIRAMQKKINERKRAHIDEMTLMREKYEQLETQVQEYHHRLIKAMRG